MPSGEFFEFRLFVCCFLDRRFRADFDLVWKYVLELEGCLRLESMAQGYEAQNWNPRMLAVGTNDDFSEVHWRWLEVDG